MSAAPPYRLRRTLRRITPLESDVQGGVLELLRRVPHEVVWVHKQVVGECVILRPDGGISARKQAYAAADAGFFKRAQIGYVVGAPEGVLDIALQLSGMAAHCELEVKQPGKRPSVAQRQRIELIRANGGCADWVDDVDEVLPLIRAWRR